MLDFLNVILRQWGEQIWILNFLGKLGHRKTEMKIESKLDLNQVIQTKRNQRKTL